MDSPFNRFKTALHEHNCNPRLRGTQGSAKCPAHDDHVASLTWAAGKTQPIVLRCQAGCSTDAILAALGLAWADISAPQASTSTATILTAQAYLARTATRYTYSNAQSVTLYEVNREEGRNGHPKTITQWAPLPGDRWIASTAGRQRVLYRLPDVLAIAQSHGEVWIAEGEQKAGHLEALGLCGTCWPGGASAWDDAYAEPLVGASRVVLLPDNDDPGRRAMSQVSASCLKRRVPVTTVTIPGLEPGGDIINWLHPVQDQRAELERLRDATPTQHPETLDFPWVSAGETLHTEYERPASLLGNELLVKGCLAMLFGDPGVGKSYLLLGMAVAVSRGEEPYYGLACRGEPARVGYLASEINAAYLRDWLHTWTQGRPPAGLLIASQPLLGSLDLLSERDRIRFLRSCESLDLIIAEPLGRLHQGDESDAEHMGHLLGLFDEARHKTGCAVLYGHHMRKQVATGEQRSIHSPSGTRRLTSDPTIVWMLNRNKGLLKWELVKNNHGIAHNPIWLRPVPGGIPEKADSPAELAERRDFMASETLDANPSGVTAKEFAALTGVSLQTARTKLAKAGGIRVGGSKNSRYVRNMQESGENAFANEPNPLRDNNITENTPDSL